jgi:hypothetical protein
MITRLATCPQCGHELTPDVGLSAPAASPPPPPPPPPPPLRPADLPRYPEAGPPRPTRSSGLSAASVPKILLGLGATCLLVAAVIFLAVAWSWLGIAGRTAVLVGLTAATGAAGQWLLRRELRMAAEALTTVALGLLVIDLVGAEDAGWLGTPGTAGFVALVGGTFLGASLALCLPRERPFVPQLVAPLGLTVLIGAIGSTTEHDPAVAALAVLAYAALAVFGRRVRSVVLPWTASACAALAFILLAGAAVEEAAAHPSFHELWRSGHGGWLVVAAALLLLPWAAVPGHEELRQLVWAASASTLTYAAALPALDEGPTVITLVAAASTVAWAVVAAAAPLRWYAVPRVPLAGSLLVLLPIPGVLVVQGLANLGSVAEPFSASVTVRLAPMPEIAHPALLPAAVAVIVIDVALTLPRLMRLAWVGGGGLLLAGLVAAAHHPLPLLAFVALPAGAAAWLMVDALRHRGPTRVGEAAAAGILGAGATLLALPSAVLTVAVLAEVAAGAAAVLVRRFREVEPVAGTVLPVAAAGLLWTVGHLAEVPYDHRSLLILVLLGGLALGAPRVELEMPAWVGVAAAAALGVPVASDPSVSAAVHLTLAGALVTASALLHTSRRGIAWVGGLLLAAATWVRLADLGVQAPEAYTLPTATVLVLLGLHRMLRDPDPDAESVPALLAGLSLATVPSLLWVLVDPVSVRATLLGLACLVILLAGTALRWSAPVLVGWLVGGLVVLRESAPYAAQTPQWVLIGAAGALLIVVGVTWEARLRDLRRATSYLGRLADRPADRIGGWCHASRSSPGGARCSWWCRTVGRRPRRTSGWRRPVSES